MAFNMTIFQAAKREFDKTKLNVIFNRLKDKILGGLITSEQSLEEADPIINDLMVYINNNIDVSQDFGSYNKFNISSVKEAKNVIMTAHVIHAITKFYMYEFQDGILDSEVIAISRLLSANKNKDEDEDNDEVTEDFVFLGYTFKNVINNLEYLKKIIIDNAITTDLLIKYMHDMIIASKNKDLLKSAFNEAKQFFKRVKGINKVPRNPSLKRFTYNDKFCDIKPFLESMILDISNYLNSAIEDSDLFFNNYINKTVKMFKIATSRLLATRDAIMSFIAIAAYHFIIFYDIYSEYSVYGSSLNEVIKKFLEVSGISINLGRELIYDTQDYKNMLNNDNKETDIGDYNIKAVQWK